jgi:hypothetical protein
LLTAVIFPGSGRKIPNGLFTPPAEPFLPPVDPSTPQLARIRTPLPQEEDDMEFKSLDENDEAGKDDSPAYAVSHSNYVCCMDSHVICFFIVLYKFSVISMTYN